MRTVQVLMPTSQQRMLQQEAGLLSHGSWARTTLKALPQSFSPFPRAGSARVCPHHPGLLHLMHVAAWQWTWWHQAQEASLQQALDADLGLMTME